VRPRLQSGVARGPSTSPLEGYVCVRSCQPRGPCVRPRLRGHPAGVARRKRQWVDWMFLCGRRTTRLTDVVVRPSTSPLDVTVSGFCRIVFVVVISVILISCSADPSGDARREEALVRALARPGTSVESIRSALTRGGLRVR